MTVERVVSRAAHFGRVPESLLFDASVSDEACRLYAFLTTFDYRRTGKAWCGREEAGARLGWSVSKVGRYLRELQGIGAIERRRGRREVMVILLHADVIQEGSQMTFLDPAKTGHPATQERSPDDPSCSRAPLIYQEVEQEGSADGGAPDVSVPNLVGMYVDDVRAVEAGHTPTRQWKAAAGRAIKIALDNGEEPVVIRQCLGIAAREGKSPSTLAHIISDYHARRPRRKT